MFKITKYLSKKNDSLLVNNIVMYFCRVFPGRGVHKPSERGVRVHAGARAGGRRADSAPAGAAGRGPHLPLPLLLLHGQRDLLPAQTLPSRRL